MPALPLNQDALQGFGRRMFAQFLEYKKDRYPLEQQWMRNLRQYRGLNDPEAIVRPYGSTAYPKFTRKWVNSTVARLMSMLFPKNEKNWDIEPSEIPELPTDQLRALLAALQQEVKQQTGQPNPDLTDEDVEKAIKALAEGRCANMRKAMLDQMEEMDYDKLARKVVFSGVLYGTGLLSGPLIEKKEKKHWKKDINTGAYVVENREINTPFFANESIWEWYPDLKAKTRASEDGHYFRRVMSRDQVRRLADRPDFLGDQIVTWLRNNTTGNYTEEYWEREVRVDGDRKYVGNLVGSKYLVLEWWGFCSGHELKAAGIDVPDEQLGEQFEANVWTLADTVIKAIINPTETKDRRLHEFVFEEDDMNRAGIGLPQICRDSQLAIVESTRMMLDNGSVVCTPSKLIKMGLLTPNHPVDSRPYQDWYQDPDAPDNSQDAVKNLTFDSHITELQSITTFFKQIGEEEVSLPPVMQGVPAQQGGSESLRTQGNMSMAMASASLPIRDTVRNFDAFTDSAMTALYNWNMEFNPDPRVKSDLNIIARGSDSLMAKEVRAQHFSLFAQTIQPEERDEIDWRKNISERMKTIDLVPDEILLPQETVQANKKAKADAIQAQQQKQQEFIDSQIRAAAAAAVKDIANAHKAEAASHSQMYQTLMDGLDRIANSDRADNQQVLDHVIALRDHMNTLKEHGQRNRELDIAQQQADTAQAAAQQPAARAA